MLQSVFVVVAVGLLAVSAADDIPEKCKSHPAVHPHECCDLPPAFDEKAMEKCGLPKPGAGPPHPHGPPRDGPPPCDKELCLFKELQIMSDDENVDTTATAASIAKWFGQDKAWAGIVDDVTKNCLVDLTEGPPGLCQPIKVVGCVMGSMFHNCPATKWTDSDDCKALKEFMSECPHPHKPMFH